MLKEIANNIHTIRKFYLSVNGLISSKPQESKYLLDLFFFSCIKWNVFLLRWCYRYPPSHMGVDACIGYLIDFLLACIIYKSQILYHPMLTMWLEISSLAIKCMHASDTRTSNLFAEFCELLAREKWCSDSVQKINCFLNLYLSESSLG